MGSKHQAWHHAASWHARKWRNGKSTHLKRKNKMAAVPRHQAAKWRGGVACSISVCWHLGGEKAQRKRKAAAWLMKIIKKKGGGMKMTASSNQWRVA